MERGAVMLYLSQLILDPRSAQVQAELRNLYEMHRTLSRAFDRDPARYDEARCLFRVDEPVSASCPRVLIQSRLAPQWERLVSNAGYLVGSPQSKAFEPVFKVGQRLAFRLRANPTVCRNGKRVAIWEKKPVGETLDQRAARLHRIEQRRLAWLVRKGKTGGFSVERVTLFSESEQSAQSGQQRMIFNAVRYEGVLRVTDADAFLTTLAAGIGSGKGLGFGLLSLARV
jgi:CRISPR system Cascade subunit CasE